jgi:hypothetical protein
MWRFDSLLARVWLGGSSIGDLAKTETVSVLFDGVCVGRGGRGLLGLGLGRWLCGGLGVGFLNWRVEKGNTVRGSEMEKMVCFYADCLGEWVE